VSRRTKDRREQIQAEAPAPKPALAPEAEGLLRRLLLTLLTALIVSRPLLRGESFGLASELSDYGGLVWAFLALLSCAAWAAWRAFSSKAEVFAGWPELALLAGIGLMFAGAAWSSYIRAALLAGWEWLGLLLVLFLTRQLATSERERQGLFCVLLATGVAMAVQGAYQATWELPNTRMAVEKDFEGNTTEYVRSQAQQRLESLSDAEADLLTRRLEGNRPSGPFLYPATLAGALVLLLPGLVAAALAAYRHGAYRWQIALSAIAALVAAAVLVATREWLFVLALLVACAVVIPQWRLSLLGAAVLGAVVLYFTGQLSDELTRRADAWNAAWALIQDERHMWIGVGPAQAPFWMPRYLSETAGAPLGPESALLRTWSEGGLLSVLLFGLAGATIAMSAWRWWQTEPPVERDAVHAPSEELPWELYLGGMLGVLVAFIVRATTLPSEDIYGAALVTALGALGWFAAFAAFEQLAWTHSERMTALMVGALALALALLVGPGWSAPSLVGLLFVVVGLMLAQASPGAVSWLGEGRVAATFPVSVFVAGGLGFLIFIVAPTTITEMAQRRARLMGQYYAKDRALPPDERQIRNPVAFIQKGILDPLQETEQKIEPRNVRTYQLRAEWYSRAWTLAPLEQGNFPRSAKAFSAAGLAHLNNLESPDGLVIMATTRKRIGEGYNAVADLRAKLAEDKKITKPQKQRTLAMAKKMRDAGKEQFGFAVESLAGAVQRDPTNPKHWYQLAYLHDKIGDVPRRREAAAKAVHLAEKVGRARRLPDQERQLAEKWRKEDPKK
jgi:hypothetical protein